LQNFISDFLIKNNIEFFGFMPFSLCETVNPALLERRFFGIPRSVCFFLIPYYVNDGTARNISKYAISRDYHLFARELFDSLKKDASVQFPEHKICGFADSSPFNERFCASRLGLGIIGDNQMLINSKYGSYVFIGEIVTDAECDFSPVSAEYCLHCGKCRAECPAPEYCLSAITQKKGKLSEHEKELMLRHQTAWGCDICQDICPLCLNVCETPIEFFRHDRIPYVTPEIIESIPETEFSERAFSWRGRNTILRNAHILCDQQKET